MKIKLSGLPLPNRAKAKNIHLCSAPRYQFFDGKLISVEAVMSSESSDQKYSCVIYQDPPEYFCDCPDYRYRHNFCKHLSKLFILTHQKETFINVKN